MKKNFFGGQTFRFAHGWCGKPKGLHSFLLLTLFAVISLLGLTRRTTPITAAPALDVPVYSYTVISQYPHDPAAFTQGLVYQDGIFYEGTGLNGQSSLRKVEVATGKVLQQINMPSQYFGEGITIWQDKIIALTWQSGVGFVYNKDSFELIRSFNYPTEGWGITHDDKKLIMSDGSARLYFWNPDTLAEIGHVDVHDEHGPVTELNELEYINGEIYANVWQTNHIARINPETGEVVGWLDLLGLLQLPPNYTQRIDVLNGIAYDAATDRLFVTGKWWPQLFDLDLIPPLSATPALTHGLVAAYSFNGQTADESEQHQPTTVHGAAALTNDRFGNGHNAYQLNGQDAYLEIPDANSLDFAAQFSLSVWLYYEPQATPTNYYTILEKSDSANGQTRYGLWLIGDRVEVCIQPSLNLPQRCLDSDTSLVPNQWQHVVGMYDGSTLRLWLNNQAVGQKSDTASGIAQNDSPLFIASDPYQSPMLFTKMTIDDLRLYNRVLNVAEIEQLYQQAKLYLPIFVK